MDKIIFDTKGNNFGIGTSNLKSSYGILVQRFSLVLEAKSRKYQGEKSSKDMASSRNLVSTIGAQASPKKGDGTRCPEG